MNAIAQAMIDQAVEFEGKAAKLREMAAGFQELMGPQTSTASAPHRRHRPGLAASGSVRAAKKTSSRRGPDADSLHGVQGKTLVAPTPSGEALGLTSSGGGDLFEECAVDVK